MSSETLNTAGAFSQANDLRNRIFFTILIFAISIYFGELTIKSYNDIVFFLKAVLIFILIHLCACIYETLVWVANNGFVYSTTFEFLRPVGLFPSPIESLMMLVIGYFLSELLINNKATIDDIYFSPYYRYSKLKKYRLNKENRKPNIGLFKKAIKKWNIDIKSSFFIGDSVSDYEAAKKLNLKFYYKKDISLYKQIKHIISNNN